MLCPAPQPLSPLSQRYRPLLSAAVKGFLTRRLLRTERVAQLVRTIRVCKNSSNMSQLTHCSSWYNECTLFVCKLCLCLYFWTCRTCRSSCRLSSSRVLAEKSSAADRTSYCKTESFCRHVSPPDRQFNINTQQLNVASLQPLIEISVHPLIVFTHSCVRHIMSFTTYSSACHPESGCSWSAGTESLPRRRHSDSR